MMSIGARLGRFLFLVMFCVLALSGSGVASLSDSLPATAQPHVPGELIIKFKAGARNHGHARVMERLAATSIREFPAVDAHHWKLGRGMPVETALEILSRPPFSGYVEYAEPNVIIQASASPHNFLYPDDSRATELESLHNFGQGGGTVDADIDAPEAWYVQTGSPDVVVAVLDSGIDYNHPDLAANIWTNPREVPNNGLDDDNNGYIDDVRGWDFYNDDNDPMDDWGHGTHVGGTLGAVGNNGIGIAGVAWRVKLVPLKILNSSGNGSVADAAAALLYAASLEDASGNKIVKITNNSWGGGGRPIGIIEDAIASTGVLFVAAAGNSGRSKPEYPAGSELDNVISVGASDHNDELASYSNYSSRRQQWVDLAAPGSLLSTMPNGDYGWGVGTSAATPVVTGVAALVSSQHPQWSVAQIRNQVLSSVDLIPALAGKMATGGRVNARAALDIPDPGPDSVAPAAIVDLAPTESSSNSVDLSWTATADDGSDPASGPAFFYDLRVLAGVPLDESNWDSAGSVLNGMQPAAPGGVESATIDNLAGGTTFFLGLKAFDEEGNASQLLDIASVTTPPTPGGAWVTQTVGPGRGADLAYDGSGNPAIAYIRADQLRFAQWNGLSWDDTAVDSGMFMQGVSLAFHPATGEPAISYSARNRLHLAQRQGSFWSRDTLETKSASNLTTGLAFDASGDLSVAYSIRGRNAKLVLAHRSGSGWTKQTIAAGEDPLYISLAYDPSGNPGVAYSDLTVFLGEILVPQDTLKFASRSGSSWNIATVEAGVLNYGQFAELAFHPLTGRPTITHSESTDVRMLTFNGNDWDLELVNAPGQTASQSSLAYAPDGTVHASYFDVTLGTLIVATRPDGAATWDYALVGAGTGLTGHGGLAVDPDGAPGLAYRNNQAGEVLYSHEAP